MGLLTALARPRLVLGAILLVVVSLTVAGIVTGRFAFYSLYTHCGIRYADVGGTRFYADPPLDDGSGNPPAGWGNPTDEGFIVVTDSTHAVFVDWALHRATFSMHPRSGIPPLQVCS